MQAIWTAFIEDVDIRPSFVVGKPQPLAIQFGTEIFYDAKVIVGMKDYSRCRRQVYRVTLAQFIESRRLDIHEGLEGSEVSEFCREPLPFPCRLANGLLPAICSPYDDPVFPFFGNVLVGLDTNGEIIMNRNGGVIHLVRHGDGLSRHRI